MSEPASGAPAPPPLPPPARRAVLTLAATVLGALPAEEVPPSLIRVRDFAPAKRAVTGAAPLAAALEQLPAFRSRVATAWRERHPELGDALHAGRVPAAADPFEVLAGLFLMRPEGWQVLDGEVRAALSAGEAARRVTEAERAKLDELVTANSRVESLTARVAELELALAEERDALAGARKELRRARADADRARSGAREAQQRAEGLAARLDESERARAEAEHGGRAALSRVQAELDAARRAVREDRALDDARLRLLLETLVEAAGGLRKELGLRPGADTPADLLGERLGARGADEAPVVPVRAQQQEDPARLSVLLSLPRTHLVVDGYNVTKSAYPSMNLADQRRRLVEGLAGLAARTGAEVTCVFDGAVTEGRSAGRVRGVRVLFSDPGVTADEVIRRIARAEPEGRVVIVASSDGEVVAGVRSAGAHTVGAMALARFLAPV